METGRAQPSPLSDDQLAWMKHDVGGTSLMYQAAYEIEKLRKEVHLLRTERLVVDSDLLMAREHLVNISHSDNDDGLIARQCLAAIA